jgi:hypothetical protein
VDSFSWQYTLRLIVHYGLHFLFPALIAFIFFRKEWKKAWLIMILTMLIDLDHLLASPILDPGRCSINFHILHTGYAMIIYTGLLFLKKTRIIGTGLWFHMLTDFQDCLWI